MSRLMLGMLIRRQVLFHFLNLRLGLGFTLVLVLVSGIGLLGAAKYRNNAAEHDERVEKHSSWLTASDTYVEHIPAIDLSPNPLTTLSNGASEAFGTTIIAPGLYSPIAIIDLSRPYEKNSSALAATIAGDLASVVSTFVTLIVLFMAFDAISRERERGTLRVLYSMSVPKWMILCSHYASAMLAVLVPVVVSFAIWVLILQIQEVPFRPNDWGAVALVMALALLLVSFFVFVALLVSAIRKRSSEALVDCILLWVLVVIVLPLLTDQLVGQITPVANAAVDAADWRVTQIPGEQLEPPPGDFFTVRGGSFPPWSNYRDQFVVGLLDPAQIARQYSQARLRTVLAYTNPVMLFNIASSRIVGTDASSYSQAVEKIMNYNEAVGIWQSRRIAENPYRARYVTNEDGRLDKTGFPVPPEVRMGYEKDISGAVAGPLLGLLVWNVFAGATLFLARFVSRQLALE